MGGNAPGGGAPQSARALVSKSTGIQQFEVVITTLPSGTSFNIGVGTSSASTASYTGSGVGSYGYNASNGQKYLLGSASAYGATYGVGDVIGVVVNFTTGALTFYKNGVSQGVASATGMLGLTLFPMAGPSSSQTTFSYATLRGRSFAFPISGASEWTGSPAIAHNVALIRGRSVAPISIGSAISVVVPYGIARLSPIYKGRNDYQTGVLGRGVGRVRGTTLDYAAPSNKPYPCRVRLVREADGYQVRETWSAADGSYDFQYIDELQSYSVLAYYAEHGKRAVIGDGLTLANGKVELMP